MMSISKVSKVIFILGGPGSGKGTQCPMIENDLGYKHISAGDLLREERSKPNSDVGGIIDKHMKDGTIVPTEITCKLLEEAMSASNKDTFLIDGFPRNEDNFKGWEKGMSHKTDLLFVLVLNCPLDICLKRCLSRGAAGSGRADDNEETIKKRIMGYEKETMPIIEHYKRKNMVKIVDTTRSPQEVHDEIKTYIEQLENSNKNATQ